MQNNGTSDLAGYFFNFKPYTNSRFYTRIAFYLLTAFYASYAVPGVTEKGKQILFLLFATPVVIYVIKHFPIHRERLYLSNAIRICQVMVQCNFLDEYIALTVQLNGGLAVKHTFYARKSFQRFYLLHDPDQIQEAYLYPLTRMRFDMYWLMYYFKQEQLAIALDTLPDLDKEKWLAEQTRVTIFMDYFFEESDRLDAERLKKYKQKYSIV